jgi:hypothetical protein
MPDPGELSLELFSDRLGELFRIHATPEVIIDAVLDEATALGTAAFAGARAPFSIVFRAPVGPGILRQQIYRLEHETLGSFELFLVPREPDARGARYEADFS